MKQFFKFILWIIIICVLIYGGMSAYHKIERYIYPTDYADVVEKYSSEYNLDKSLVFAVIKCESGFDKNAESSQNAKGLMQLQKDTYEWVCHKYNDNDVNEEYLFNPEKNVQAGCRLLRLHLDQFGDVKTALCAYHAGRTKTMEWLNNSEYSSDGKTLSKIPYEDTSSYVDKVIKTQEKYKQIYKIQ